MAYRLRDFSGELLGSIHRDTDPATVIDEKIWTATCGSDDRQAMCHCLEQDATHWFSEAREAECICGAVLGFNPLPGDTSEKRDFICEAQTLCLFSAGGHIFSVASTYQSYLRKVA